jgi:hypothetical protein
MAEGEANRPREEPWRVREGAELRRGFAVRWGWAAGAIIGLAALAGCSGSTSAPGNEASPAAEKKSAVSAANSAASNDPRINLECTAERIQNAPAPFHWSYKKSDSAAGKSDREADITPDSIQGTLVDSSGTRPIHAVRSDAGSWNVAVLMLAGALPASTIALVNNSSATTRTGTEQVNGENAIKYVIDTTRSTPEDAALITNVMGPNGFIKGTAWVTGDGCVVKMLLDTEMHLRDGSVETEHYDAEVTHK